MTNEPNAEVAQAILQAADGVGNKITELFGALSNQIGVGVEYFWPVFVKQYYIEAISDIAIWIVLAIFGSILIRRGIVGGDKKDWKDGSYIVLLIAGGIMAIFCASTFAITGGDVAGKILNPEYYAIQDIIRKVR